MKENWKLPRLYVPDLKLAAGSELALEGDAHHYIRNVMRKNIGDKLRVFNQNSGEFLAEISHIAKKQTTLVATENLREKPPAQTQIGLLVPVLKKDRMDWVVQKAVELGATDFYPITTQFSDISRIKEDRLMAQMIEAAEQCERLDIPNLHPIKDMKTTLKTMDMPVFAAIERCDGTKPILECLKGQNKGVAFLIGPVGGFSEEEKQNLLNTKNVVPVDLGERILRAETAVTYVLSVWDAVKNQP